MDVKRQNMYGGYTNTPPYLNKYYYQYLTVEMLEGGEFYRFPIVYTDGSSEIMYYSKNDGPWTAFPDSINVSVGDKIRFKQTVDPSKTIDGHSQVMEVELKFNVYGNIMSMIYGDDFIGNDELTGLTWDFSPFAYWFYGCGVCDASNLCLPSTRLCESMYMQMFSESLLTKAPSIIPAHLSDDCYYSMFSDCKYLTGQITIPQPLSATKDTHAYEEMFATYSRNNTGLELIILALLNKYVSASDLYSIIDQNHCKCRVVLPWEGMGTLADSNNSDVFSAELKYFNYEHHGDTEPIGFTKFEMSPDVFGQVLDIQNANSLFHYFGLWDDTFIDSNCTAIEPLQYFLNIPLTFETLDVCEFTWFGRTLYTGELVDLDFLEYSINGGAWVKYSKGVIVPANTIISWRTFKDSIEEDLNNEDMSLTLITNGVKLTGTTTTTCRFNAHGNIMSLISKNFETLNTIPYNNCFKGMFANTQIQSAEKLILPAINLSKACYKEMFKDSTLIISPRILPVKNPRNISSIYESMFYNCYNLQTIPILMLATLFDPPVNGISSGSSEYIGLYETCTNICHSMFYDCTSLSVAPEIHICYLNTTTGQGKHFQYMFSGCSNIKQYKIFTHSSTPGNYYGHNYIYYFRDMFVGSDGGGQFFAYDTFSNNTGDLNLFTIASNIGIDSDMDDLIDMHGDPVIPDEEESQKSVFYINNQGTNYEFEKTYEGMTWDQFLSQTIKLGNVEYPIEFTKSNHGYNSIAVYDIYSTSGEHGYGQPFDKAGRICNSNNERDNVLKTEVIQTGKTYYINRYFNIQWW